MMVVTLLHVWMHLHPEAIANSHKLSLSEIRRMAKEIMVFWGLSDKTHSTYKDLSSNLVFSIADQAERQRRKLQ